MPPQDELGDATRRTSLATERTWLAWVRTGFTATAVSIGVGRLVPAVTGLARWPYTVIGVGYALLGVALVVYGLMRRREVEAAIRRGEYVSPDDRMLFGFVGFAAVLGLLSGVVVLVN
jgi:inner membrane protein YidH